MRNKLLIFLILPIFFLYAQNSCENKLFTIKSRPGLKIKEFIDNLSYECGFTVIYEDNYVKKRLYERIDRVNLKDVTLNRLLDVLLGPIGVDYKIEKDILKLRYLLTKTFHIDYITSIREAESTTDASVDIGASGGTSGTTSGETGSKETRDVNTITSLDKFDFWSNLKKEIHNIINRPEDRYKAPEPVINENAGLITVTATKKQIKRVERYIDLIEQRLHKEVLIDVSILAVLLDDSFTSGIDWSQFNLTLNGAYNAATNQLIQTSPLATYQSIGVGSNFKNLTHTSTATTVIDTAFNLSGLINFLKKNGKVVTLSNPKILTLNNQPAIITIGETLNYNVPTKVAIPNNSTTTEKSYTPSSIFVGILLNITPEITDNNEIILRINPSISELRNPEEAERISPEGFRQIAPDTKEKKISTVLKLKDGNTLILGGLISNSKNFLINGVPVLKDLPLFGNLFKSRKNFNQRFELVFVIKPKIINMKNIKDFKIKDLGYKVLKYDK